MILERLSCNCSYIDLDMPIIAPEVNLNQTASCVQSFARIVHALFSNAVKINVLLADKRPLQSGILCEQLVAGTVRPVIKSYASARCRCCQSNAGPGSVFRSGAISLWPEMLSLLSDG